MISSNYHPIGFYVFSQNDTDWLLSFLTVIQMYLVEHETFWYDEYKRLEIWLEIKENNNGRNHGQTIAGEWNYHP